MPGGLRTSAPRPHVTTIVAVAIHVALYLAIAARSLPPSRQEAVSPASEPLDTVELLVETLAESSASEIEEVALSPAPRHSHLEPAPSPPEARPEEPRAPAPEPSVSPIVLFAPAAIEIGLS
ncbi:MAG TPA: hypothetical protein VM925_05135, partial [Labilithrix sp.]|nr:hypothetical protein [Labilithrix sp.]